jgi:putative spermidine/putrescine transport system ATP-binding protein
VSVYAADRAILDSVSLGVPDGSVCGVFGPSGAGKTTLLRAIGGWSQHDGQIRLDGDVIDRVAPGRRGVVTLFQEPRLFPSMSLVDNVAYSSRVRGIPRAARRVAAQEALAEVGLAHRSASRPHGLSGGEQQRVALARALHAEPRLLLLDEPLTALDGPRRDELRSLIGVAVRRRSLTTLLVSHELSDAVALADRLAVLIDGRLEQLDTPDGVMNRPRSTAVATLTGNPNRIPGRVVGGVLWSNGVAVGLAGAEDGDGMWTIRPEHIGFAPSGILGLVSRLDHRVTHVVVHLDSPLGSLMAVVAPDLAPRLHERVHMTLRANTLWRFPPTTSEHE